jgi:hypothetical protein
VTTRAPTLALLLSLASVLYTIAGGRVVYEAGRPALTERRR